uniref:Uncharacterized protein n=1 Tax=Arundo donax TaxID=35708 RepID=A0A0A9GKE6_ARUDO
MRGLFLAHRMLSTPLWVESTEDA